ncbi:vesicle-trafficking protein SEC22b-B [Polypterus senegalus]|uniref:vesicle-trafficking protein SEC22b-B n=1 Tax=Polypterus senegalus TaxID=55291 RepID=UPI001962E59C|nr:vesicle-trafficking protein SEC22b-B [Polypterus senegalus]
MVLLTMIARIADGLPLAASMQEDEQSGRDLQQYQNQAKQLFRKLNEHSPTRCTLEAGPVTFHYAIEKGVCYLVLCEASFAKKLAFAYLEDLQAEFDEQHGKKVSTVSRPYSFIEFDTYIQKTKKSYIDSRARRNLGSINSDLQDVQRIMVANIEEVLQRGEALSGDWRLDVMKQQGGGFTFYRGVPLRADFVSSGARCHPSHGTWPHVLRGPGK